jgi:hypothetical protein
MKQTYVNTYVCFFIDVYRKERDAVADQYYGTSTKQALEIQKMNDSRESQKAHRKPCVNASWLNVQLAK